MKVPAPNPAGPLPLSGPEPLRTRTRTALPAGLSARGHARDMRAAADSFERYDWSFILLHRRVDDSDSG